MKRNIFLVLITLITAVDNNLFAQTLPVTMRQAIELSIKNSKTLKSSNAKIEEATAALKEAVERRLPDVNVSGSYLRIVSSSVNVKIKTSSEGNGSEGESNRNPSSALYGIANVSLPLYSGFAIKYGIESSKYLQQAAKLDADNDREAIIYNTIEAYENLYKSKSAVDLVKENLEATRQRVKDFSNLEKNGLLARNDLLKTELQESNIELSLLDAENNWKLANINMNLMLGLPDSTVISVNESDLQSASVELKPVEDYVQSALQNRKDISAVSYRKKAAGIGIKSANAQKYPSIALTGGFIGADIPKVLTVTNAINVGVGVRYNLAFWKTNTPVAQAKAREKELAANEEALYNAVQLEVNRAYQNYVLSEKKIEVYEKAVAQAEENYKIVKNKFSNTLATTTDLLDADIAQLQAKLNASFSKADAAVAYNKLLQTAGQLESKTQTK